MNERDSEIMSQALAGSGYVETMEMESADLVILNTCSIRAKAEQKVMSLLGLLRKQKKRHPEMQVCVAGCVAQQEGEKLVERMEHVDLVVGTQNIYQIDHLLEHARKNPGYIAISMEKDYTIPVFLPDQAMGAAYTGKGDSPSIFRKFVTIMQGCNNFCAYCVVPHTRGREVSRNVKDIKGEIRVLLESGIKEITLLGQNVNSYGQTNIVTSDGAPFSFAELLHEIAHLEGLQRLRFTTSNPKDLSDDLMKCFRDIPNLCPQFHLPVQAGSDKVLKRMNRKYSIARYLELVEQLREYCPDIALSTDIIVGFPGETDKDFEETMGVLERVRYHGSFSFKYSDRPGTAAEKFNDKVDENVKKERLMRFQDRQDEISLDRNREYVGTIREVLVESASGKALKGRTVTNHIVHVDDTLGRILRPGDLVDAEIYHAGQHSLKGKLARMK
ncbi:tRNA (N6-isopentenyl adenosine(37)-C2)-methylthiotransferase MiaB [Desulfopila sp. IMCC35008]|uniref:tRNA (N6-isopentenyl adenosine(37)-C2)-methylthiotransferase MiaB n=1 Tax=Desulfopila sp. IMCC35008 TaxID=2653858 RepID=UPI001F10CB42|nr:tRNA (N6-isopentenyl adenosine(37)-C2)-methylthiotransferase MiaB [Desulfopila sp. IMCC35008]